MYTVLTKASIGKLLVLTGVQVYGASSSTCPSQLVRIDHTSNICTKLINAQVGCVTNVDSYSLYACTHVASMRDISKTVCYHQVLFAAVTKLQQFDEKTTNNFAGAVFKKKSTYNLLRMCAYNYTLLQNNPFVSCVPSLSTMWKKSTCPIRQLAPCSPTP